MCLDNILPVEDLLHKDFEGTPSLKFGHRMFLQLIAQFSLIFFIPRSQTASLESDSLHDERKNVHTLRQLRPAHGTQMHDAAISTCCVKIVLKIRRADEVDDDVNALTVCRFQNLLGPVLGMVVEASSCTEFPRAEVNLLLRPSCYIDR